MNIIKALESIVAIGFYVVCISLLVSIIGIGFQFLFVPFLHWILA